MIDKMAALVVIELSVNSKAKTKDPTRKSFDVRSRSINIVEMVQ